MREQLRSRGARIGTVAGAVAVAMGASAPAHAVQFATDDGWSAAFDGVISAFYVQTKDASDSGAAPSANEARIMSGFNPSKFNAHFGAPTANGLKVTGNFQFAANISGNSTGGASAGAPNNDSNGFFGMDVRVLDINVAGDWGTVSMGRSWGIFSGSSIVYDEASGSGVGHLCGTAGNTFGGTCGRIGAGYTWTAFAARLEYDTPDLGGFSARLGLFDPANGTGAQTKTPRIEAEGSYGGKFDSGAYKLWVGGLTQSLSAPVGGGHSATMNGVDLGAHVDVGGFGLTLAGASTKGFGAGGFKFGGIDPASGEVTKDTQAYVDASYKAGSTRFGASWGMGKQDATATAFDATKSKLGMLYVHHDLTPQARLSVELDNWNSTNETTGANQSKYKVFTVGLLYNI